jgi:hypothetical protein
VVLTGKVILNGKKRRLDYGVVVGSLSHFPFEYFPSSYILMIFFMNDKYNLMAYTAILLLVDYVV